MTATGLDTDAETIRNTAREVLSGSDYQMETPDDISRVIDWLRDFLRPISRFFDSLYDASPLIYYALLVGLFLLLAAMIWHIGYSLHRAMQRRRVMSDYTPDDKAGDTLPGTWDSRAREAYESGDFLLAIRFLLHGSLLRLETARRAKFRTGTTNREYLRRYRNNPAYEPLAQLVEITDSRWFGGIDCTRSDVEACMFASERITRLVTEGPGNADRP